MTIHETFSELSPAEVIERARSFFALAGTPSSAFPEKWGEGYLKLHVEVGEIVIAALREGGSTRVRGSASRGAQLLTSFLTTLAPPLRARRTVHRYGHHEAIGARTAPHSTNSMIAPAATSDAVVAPPPRAA